MQQRLDLHQTQSLVMTPQLRQAIELLQMTNLELGELIEQEQECNPLLESAKQEASDSQEQAGEVNNDGDAYEALVAPGEVDSALDVDHSNDFDPEMGDYTPSRAEIRECGQVDMDRTFGENLAKPESLRDHLTSQLTLGIESPVDRIIGSWLIEGLDENGWMQTPLAGVAESLRVDESRVLAVLKQMQEFDPPGIFARNLAECLRLQILDRGELDDDMDRLLTNLHLVDGRAKELTQMMGLDPQALSTLFKRLRELDPRPAMIFEHVPAETLIPDVIMIRTDSGYDVMLNPETAPDVEVNTGYYESLSKDAKGDTQKYLKERFFSANWLMRSIRQRNQTILRVSKEIIRRQKSFFDQGVLHLKPLVLRDIATAVEMHESTISRATANKYISTPRGILEFRYFFGSSILSGNQMDQVSSTVVRHKIGQLVNQEDANNVLSDDQLVQLLAEENIFLARRTVAKYRDLLKIPSSIERRRRKVAQMPLA